MAILALSGCRAPEASATADEPARPPSEECVLVRDGVSGYVIYHATNAPASVVEAARDLQRAVGLAAGPLLPIVQAPQARMIVLGDTPETRRAGIDPTRLPEEGFRIQTQDRQVYIAGCDTRDGETTPEGGVSDGTYYGVMEFLERVVGVRWLMPVPGGEDIPRHQTLRVQDMALTDAPDFRSRVMGLGWGRKESAAWMRVMRIARARQPMALDYNHAWARYGMTERLKGHPDYMALVKGKRTDVADWKGPEPWKFCTTSEGLIDLYSRAVLEAMEANPTQRMWSIGPADGGAWCECERCRALDEVTDPARWPGNAGNLNGSLTRRIFTFCNEVARRVGAKQPDKRLGCLAYAAYTYPPAKPMAIESNLVVMLAARPYYGFSLYHPDLAAEFTRLVEAWDLTLHGRIGWFDYSAWEGLNRCSVGAPYPPAIPILKLIFPAIKQRGWPAVYWAAAAVRGYGGLNTYLVAKLMWHADADVEALAKDWLDRAYGPGGEAMGRLYGLLDQALADYKRSRTYDFQYRCTPELVQAVQAPLFPRMEALYKEALAKVQTEAQRARLEMFGDNLVLLHWNLRKAGWQEQPETSMFHRSDAAFKVFIERACRLPSLSLIPPTPERYLKPQLGEVLSLPVSIHE